MWPRAVIFALSLALSGTYGCAQISFRSSLTSDAAEQTTNLTSPPASEAPVSAALLALIRQQDLADENLFAPIVFPETVLPSKTEKLGVVGSPATKVSKAPEETLTALQRVPGPPADDRLLDLVEKDLKKAVEQPNEKRRLQFSKAVVENPRVRYFINYFSKHQRDLFAKALARSGKYFTMIAKVLKEEGLPEDFAYLALVESYFSPEALSRAGAVGLWQFVPVTARQYGLKIDGWIDERRDPIKSTRAAAAYLKDLHRAFDRWYFATAAYNAGQGAMEKVMQSSRPNNFAALIEKTKLSAETRNFLPKFVAAALIAASPEKYGFGNVVQDAPPEYEEIEVRGNLQLASLAEMAATDTETLRQLNPALLRIQTPPGENGYLLRLPVGHASTFELAYGQSRETEEAQIVTHEVKRGETIFSIARHYGQQVRALMELNGLTDSRLRIGQKLKIIFEGLRDTLR
jgi:transglycosylase-like protein with SLT domain/LysM domain-containing protein